VLSLLGTFGSLALLVSVSDVPAPSGHAFSTLDVGSYVAEQRSVLEAALRYRESAVRAARKP
jgi:hypothetical protein